MAAQPAGFRSASAAPGDFSAKASGRDPRFGTGGAACCAYCKNRIFFTPAQKSHFFHPRIFHPRPCPHAGRQKTNEQEEWGMNIPGMAPPPAPEPEPEGEEAEPEPEPEDESELDFLRRRVKELEAELAAKNRVERRIDPQDGQAKTLEEFLEAYGNSRAEWDEAEAEDLLAANPEEPLAVERRIDPADGQAKTLEEFLEAHPDDGQEVWDGAEPAPEEKPTPKIKRRIDPADSVAKTLQAFVEAYGLAEWDGAELVPEEEPGPERRIDPADGAAKTLEEFLEAAPDTGQAEWDAAGPAPEEQLIERRIDPADSVAKTLEEFVEAYGLSEWDGAEEGPDEELETPLVPELRYDPEDGELKTLEGFLEAYDQSREEVSFSALLSCSLLPIAAH